MYAPKPTTIEASPTHNRFTGYGEGYLVFDGQTFRQSVFITPAGVIEAISLAQDWALVPPDDFILFAEKAMGAEILLIGTGETYKSLSPEQLLPFIQRGFGLEIMATRAACRTYNLLADEGRKTAALILLPCG